VSGPHRDGWGVAFVEPLRELGPANVIYTDGDAVFLSDVLFNVSRR